MFVNIISQPPASVKNTSGSKTPCPREDSLLSSRQQGRVTRDNKGESPGTTRTSHRGGHPWLARAVTRATTRRHKSLTHSILHAPRENHRPSSALTATSFRRQCPATCGFVKYFLTPQTQCHIQQNRAPATRTHTSGAGTFRPLMCYIKEDFRPICSVSPP